MKKILKTVSCIFVTAFALAGACACNNGVSDMRSRERQLRERQRQEQQRISEQEEKSPNDEEIDPGFTVDPEFPECPDCPDVRGKHNKPKPAPYPLPRN